MRRCLTYLVSLFVGFCAMAQGGGADRYRFMLESPKVSLTGIAIIVEGEDTIKGSIVNEFGISAIDFQYVKKKDKVKLVNVAGPLDRWYIRHTLRGDLRQCLKLLYPPKDIKGVSNGGARDASQVTFYNNKRKLGYSFTAL